jgi:hypothetical protein
MGINIKNDLHRPRSKTENAKSLPQNPSGNAIKQRNLSVSHDSPLCNARFKGEGDNLQDAKCCARKSRGDEMLGMQMQARPGRPGAAV